MSNVQDFNSLNLSPHVLQIVAKLGWTEPTKIQVGAVPIIIDGRDLVGIAMTGSGKTAAFALPIINRWSVDSKPAATRRPPVLVLVPTRELAQQVGEVFNQFSAGLPVRNAVVYGGVGYARQRKMLAAGVEVLIATPGRLIDLMNQGHALLDRVEVLVLDEADRMLDMGFQAELDVILAKLPTDRQSLFFSATFPPQIRRLSSKLLRDAIELFVDVPATQVDLLEQYILPVREADKQNLLYALLAGQIKQHQPRATVVFANSRSLAGRFTRYLSRRNIAVAMMHGGMSQTARDDVLRQLRAQEITTLVATDVAARGIDFDALSHVINIEVPLSVESYVHRVGRTARAGLAGTSLTFATPTDMPMLRNIEKQIGQRISIEANHPFAIELPEYQFTAHDQPTEEVGRQPRRLKKSEDGKIERKVRKTSSGKLAVVEYKVGARRRSLSGKIRTGGGVRQSKDKFAPAWKKKRPAKRAKKS